MDQPIKEKVSTITVQHGLGRKNIGRQQTMWIEEPGICHLHCSYCYADSGNKLEENRLLGWEDYVSMLDQAKEQGVDSIGIPGAGEPFIGKNKNLTMRLLHKCAELGMYVTLFTTGDLLNQELVDELYELPVEIMIKGNSLIPEKQDMFVSNPELGKHAIHHGYGEKRNEALNLLMAKGFNDPVESMKKFGRKSRMALVTSIMISSDGRLSNADEIHNILRYCRDRNIIFDVDTVLERGRGAECRLNLNDKRLKNILRELQQIDMNEYPEIYRENQWQPGQGYIGTVCDRYMHHMYVNQYGDIRPCIGATGVDLGNIRDTRLETAWNKPEMQIIRNREYIGPCAECGNFKEGRCNSCIGRCGKKELTGEDIINEGGVPTVGCIWQRKG